MASPINSIRVDKIKINKNTNIATKTNSRAISDLSIKFSRNKNRIVLSNTNERPKLYFN